MTTEKEQKIDEMVKSRLHRRILDDEDSREKMMLRVRNVLNVVFMLLAVIGAVVYVSYDVPTGGWIIGAAVIVKTVEVAFRLFKV
ncbi:MAG: mechanosensitive ion channel protein MscS [Prevotella sp.]